MPPTLFPGVALVTGAAGTGIGAAVARAFAAAGCTRIAITDLNGQLLEGTSARILQDHQVVKIDLLAVVGNIAEEEFVDGFVEKVVQRWGSVDYAVNCAGIMGNNQPSAETSVEDFNKINDVNYRGCWMSSRAEIRAMLKQSLSASHDGHAKRGQRGAIVNIASQLGIVGRPSAPAYCASKAAVIALTRSDAIDYASASIRVNCICPGVIDTPMTNSTPERREMLKPAVEIAPMKRMGFPEEVADAALWLCSTQASFVQGHALVVDGGYVIN